MTGIFKRCVNHPDFVVCLPDNSSITSLKECASDVHKILEHLTNNPDCKLVEVTVE